MRMDSRCRGNHCGAGPVPNPPPEYRGRGAKAHRPKRYKFCRPWQFLALLFVIVLSAARPAAAQEKSAVATTESQTAAVPSSSPMTTPFLKVPDISSRE